MIMVFCMVITICKPMKLKKTRAHLLIQEVDIHICSENHLMSEVLKYAFAVPCFCPTMAPTFACERRVQEEQGPPTSICIFYNQILGLSIQYLYNNDLFCWVEKYVNTRKFDWRRLNFDFNLCFFYKKFRFFLFTCRRKS